MYPKGFPRGQITTATTARSPASKSDIAELGAPAKRARVPRGVCYGRAQRHSANQASLDGWPSVASVILFGVRRVVLAQPLTLQRLLQRVVAIADAKTVLP